MRTRNVQCAQKSPFSSATSELAEFGARMFELSLDNAAEFMKQSSEFWISSFSSLINPKKSASCCDIPELDCPPRCACELHWAAVPGEKLKALITVINRSNQARNFAFQARPFKFADKEIPGPVLTPASAVLQPNESMAVAAELRISETFQPGSIYRTEVVIAGSYERCVCITLCVERETVSHCSVELGDPPVRIRAHEWYDHFQCVEACAPSGRTFEQPLTNPKRL